MERTTQKQKPTAEYLNAVENGLDTWVPACGGHELPFMHNGFEWLYVYNPARNEHAYLKKSTDVVQENAPWENTPWN